MKTRRDFFLGRIGEISSDMGALRREFTTRLKPLLVRYGYWVRPTEAFYPSTIILVVNGDCNAKCKMCDFGTRSEGSFSYDYVKGKPPIGLPLLKRIVEQVAGRASDLWFMATEPLLYAHLIEAIRYASKHGLRTHVTTNGILLEEKAGQLIDSGIYRINVSIDGPPQVNDLIRGIPGAFDKACRGIKEVLRMKKNTKANANNLPFLGVNCCISEYNAAHLTEFIEQFKDMDIDYIHFNHLQFVTQDMASRQRSLNKDFNFTAAGVFQTDPARVDTAVLKQEIFQIEKKHKNQRIEFAPHIKGKDIDRFYLEPHRFLRGYKRCYYPWRHLHILPDGEVIVAYRCFSGNMGNISRQDLGQIWNGDKFRRFRKFIKDNGGALDVCSRCSLIFCSYYL